MKLKVDADENIIWSLIFSLDGGTTYKGYDLLNPKLQTLIDDGIYIRKGVATKSEYHCDSLDDVLVKVNYIDIEPKKTNYMKALYNAETTDTNYVYMDNLTEHDLTHFQDFLEKDVPNKLINLTYEQVKSIVFSRDSYSDTDGYQCYNSKYGYYDISPTVLPEQLFSTKYDSANNFDLIRFATNITVPPSCTEIGVDWFKGCNLLTNINLLENLVTIGDGAFDGCSLQDITIPTSVTYYNSPFYKEYNNKAYPFYTTETVSGITYLLNGQKIVIGVDNTLESVVIPDSVITIMPYTFYGNTTLKSIILSKNLRGIGKSAFEGCTNLTTVTVQSNIKYIGERAFYGCSNVSTIARINSLDYLGKDAFEGTGLVNETEPTYFGGILYKVPTSLSSITIKSTCETINKYAFQDCTEIVSISTPTKVSTIEDYAFYNCTSLNSITILNPNATVGNKAFYGCNNIDYITLNGELINVDNGGSIEVTIDQETLNQSDVASDSTMNSSEEITVDSSIDTIGSQAFKGLTQLKTLTIPNSVTSIEEDIVDSCSNLKTVVFNQGDNTVTLNRLSNTESSITSITLPKVFKCSSSPLENLTKLESVYIDDIDNFNLINIISKSSFDIYTNTAKPDNPETSYYLESYPTSRTHSIVFEVPHTGIYLIDTTLSGGYFLINDIIYSGCYTTDVAGKFFVELAIGDVVTFKNAYGKFLIDGSCTTWGQRHLTSTRFNIHWKSEWS